MRTDLIANSAQSTIDLWKGYNYLIGGSLEQFPLVEMDVIDLFLLAGVLGVIVYFYLLFKFLFVFQKGNKLAWAFVVSFLLIGALAGHVYASGINSIVIVVGVLSLKSLNIR
jgi:hypothetical protein